MHNAHDDIHNYSINVPFTGLAEIISARQSEIWSIEILRDSVRSIDNSLWVKVSYFNFKQYYVVKFQSRPWKYMHIHISDRTIALYIDMKEERYSHCQRDRANKWWGFVKLGAVPRSRKSFARQVFRDMYFHARAIFHKVIFLSWCMVILHKRRKLMRRFKAVRDYIHLQSCIQIMGLKALGEIRHFRPSWIIKPQNCERWSNTSGGDLRCVSSLKQI